MENKKFVVRCRGIIVSEGKLLVVRHPESNFTTLPGGHLDWGEDVKECMRREIVEELGVSPEVGRLLYVNNFIDVDETQSIEFFFEILNSRDFKDNVENTKRTHAHEIEAILWVEAGEDRHILPKTLWEDFKTGSLIHDEVRYIGIHDE